VPHAWELTLDGRDSIVVIVDLSVSRLMLNTRLISSKYVSTTIRDGKCKRLNQYLKLVDMWHRLYGSELENDISVTNSGRSWIGTCLNSLAIYQEFRAEVGSRVEACRILYLKAVAYVA
jgi:hypothetical protein